MGHRVMEHEKDCSSPQEKGRKTSRKENETGRIGKSHRDNPFFLNFLQLSKSDATTKLVKTLFFRVDYVDLRTLTCFVFLTNIFSLPPEKQWPTFTNNAGTWNWLVMHSNKKKNRLKS